MRSHNDCAFDFNSASPSPHSVALPSCGGVECGVLRAWQATHCVSGLRLTSPPSQPSQCGLTLLRRR
jgi:hypothetical protein